MRGGAPSGRLWVVDAILIARTCLLFDKDNDQIRGLVESLEGYKQPRQTNAALFQGAQKARLDRIDLGQNALARLHHAGPA